MFGFFVSLLARNTTVLVLFLQGLPGAPWLGHRVGGGSCEPSPMGVTQHL